MNFMDKNIKLKEILEDVKSGKDFSKKIKVRTYIPILEKGTICRKYMFGVGMLDASLLDPVLLETECEIKWKFEVLFEYTNIEVEDDDKTFDNYDMLMSCGVFDFIRKKCEWDCSKMGDFIKSAMGINDMTVVAQILRSANGDEIKSAINELKEVVGDKSIVEGLTKLLAFNDPIMNEAIEKEKAEALIRKVKKLSAEDGKK